MASSEIGTSAATTAKAVVAAAASVAASAVFIRTIVNDLLPANLQDSLAESLSQFLARFSSNSTIVIEEYQGYAANYMYKAAEAYLGDKLPSSTRRLKVNKEDETDGDLEVTIDRGEEVVDVYDGDVVCRWRLVCHRDHLTGPQNHHSKRPMERRFYQLSFHKAHRGKVLARYLPHVVDRWRAIREANKGLKIHTGNYEEIPYAEMSEVWTAAKLDHPTTFETLAMEPELKSTIMEDLRRFVRRKEYYRKVGKAWKRGYLLYGPPGTGKSSLIAAMANHLRFDIYDLDLGQVKSNSDLRKLLLATVNRSLLVVEDIDCSVDLPNRDDEEKKMKDNEGEKDQNEKKNYQQKVTLSGLLNLVDGLWSSCGDERIIVFTTNYKDRLDPAMLRPGRMDMHIHMSYCTPAAFRVLASNYHAVTDHRLFGEIDRLLGEVEVSPAELAEELLRSEEVDVALQRVVDLLEEKERKKIDDDGHQ